jgi:hypothetical protein
MPSKIFLLNNIKPSFVPAVAWLIISIILLTLPGSAFPKENWLDKIWLDKWIHIGLFAILVTLWCRAMLKRNSDGIKLRTFFIWIGLTSLAYGIIMEFVQEYLVPNRSFDVGDIIADGIGCTLGFIYSTRSYIKK